MVLSQFTRRKITNCMKVFPDNLFTQDRTKRPRDNSGLTRPDLLTLVVVMVFLGGWFAFFHLGERGRIARCARNLEVLGQAMQGYANEHGGAIPPAGVETPQTTWDLQIAPYVGAHQNQDGTRSEESLLYSVAARFVCPSDPLHRGTHPRTYAMSFHDMIPENWPPGPDNTTGVGLWWDSGSMTSLLGQVTTNLEDLSLVKLSWMPDPSGTILLTEYPQKNNRLGHVDDVRVRNSGEQISGLKESLTQMHYGRFNYLMADGHVELFSSLQTGGIDGTTGSWTLKPGD